MHALNRIAEGAAMLAQAIENSAWESFEDHVGATGAHPIPAVQIVKGGQTPVQTSETASPTSETAPTPTPALVNPEPVTPQVSLVELRTLLAELSQAGHTDRVRGLITGLGFDKLSEVPETQYAALYSQAVALREEVFDEPPF